MHTHAHMCTHTLRDIGCPLTARAAVRATWRKARQHSSNRAFTAAPTLAQAMRAGHQGLIQLTRTLTRTCIPQWICPQGIWRTLEQFGNTQTHTHVLCSFASLASRSFRMARIATCGQCRNKKCITRKRVWTRQGKA